jgi:hypothetical protein
VDVVISPARKAFPTSRFSKPPRTLFELPPDELEYWETDDEQQLEGWTHEEVLLKAVFDRNILRHAPEIETSPEERRIVEDMVLLQVVEDEDKFEDLWKKAKQELDLPDITGLAQVKRARWLDYTQPARNLTKQIYRRVLEASRERGDAKQYRS